MQPLRLFFCACFFLAATSAQAMEGSFDRSVEIAKHLDAIKTGTRVTVIDATKEIFLTGISDAQLAAALSERLLAEVAKVQGGGIAKQYMESMVRALASTSIDYAATIQRVAKDGQTMHINAFCKEELAQMNWYKTRNEVMASRKYYQEGGDVRVARTMNLLVSDDFLLKEYGAERMNWDRILDPVLMEEIARQIPLYMNQVGARSAREQVNALGYYVKLLGFSGNTKYRDTLTVVLKSNAHPQVKVHAKGALADLRL